MPSFLNDAWEWLYHAEQARKAAEQLTDRDAKEVMLQLGLLYLRLAHAAFVQARAREGEFVLATQPGTLQRSNTGLAWRGRYLTLARTI